MYWQKSSNHKAANFLVWSIDSWLKLISLRGLKQIVFKVHTLTCIRNHGLITVPTCMISLVWSEIGQIRRIHTYRIINLNGLSRVCLSQKLKVFGLYHINGIIELLLRWISDLSPIFESTVMKIKYCKGRNYLPHNYHWEITNIESVWAEFCHKTIVSKG